MATEQKAAVVINEQQKDAMLPDDNGKKKTRSFGNKAFDLIVWPTIQWVGVWGFSLHLADKAKNGTGVLNKVFESSRQWLAPKLQSLAKNPNSENLWRGVSAKTWADNAVLIVALSLGGTILLPVLKILEDRRDKISAAIDKAFHKPPANQDTIKEEPKQTWGSMIKGRLSSLALGYTAFLVVGPNAEKAVEKKFGAIATKVFMKIRPQANRVKVNNWADLAVFDLFFTAVTAGVTYGASRFLAGKQKNETISEVLVNAPSLIEADAPETIQTKKKMAQEDLKYKKPQVTQNSWKEGQETRRQSESPAVGVIG